MMIMIIANDIVMIMMARKRTELTPRTGGKEKAKAPKRKRALSPESQQRREKALARLQLSADYSN